MKKIVIFSLSVSVLFLAQCARKTTPAATTAKGNTAEAATIVADANKNYTDAQKEQGKAIYLTSCNKCHKLYAPADHDVMAWESILKKMNVKAKLSDEQGKLVHAWIVTNAKIS